MFRNNPLVPLHPQRAFFPAPAASVPTHRTADSAGASRSIPLRRAVLRAVACMAVLPLFFSACGSTPDAAPSPVHTPSFPPPSPSSTATTIPSATATVTATPTREPVAERLAIIEYHHSSIQLAEDVMMKTEWFQSQMDWLEKNGYRTITAEQLDIFLDGGEIPAKSVVLTFDIGTAQRADYIENIIPALRQHGFHALFFVVTNAITDDCGQENKVCWKDLRDWAGEGLISVESHTVYHPDFATIAAAEQRWNAVTSRDIIAEKMGRAPVGFAFPYDSYNDGAVGVVKSLGYRFALAGNTRNDRSVHRSDPDRYNLPRVYPYSNPQIYPAIYGANGLSFGEMISASTEMSFSPTPTPLENTAAPGTTAVPSPDSESYFAACVKIDQITDTSERLYALDQLALTPSLGPDAQSELSSPIIAKPSCNVARGNVPRGVVLHATRGPLSGTLNEFQRPQNTSAHYVIDRNGQVYQLVPETLGAYHVSCGGSRSVCLPTCPLCEGPDGSFLEPYLQSIGIELVNDGQLVHPETYTGLIYEDYLMSFGYRYWEDFPEAQLQALVVLVNDIRARWGIPLDLVVGHYRINYKTDPGPALNISWYRSGNPPRAPIFSE
jgi:peptidoglycan/xylan/chitin deacetylase (PgdA/CDA1 family)